MAIKTSWGTITLTLKDGTVVACALPPLDKTPDAPFRIAGFQSLEKLIEAFPGLGKTVVPQRRCFPNIGKPKGTNFQKAVWDEISKIPRGQTRTYGEVAAAIGRPGAVRAVGTACGANPLPLFIPCHRVVAKNGLGGFGSGLPWKKMLLQMEGSVQTKSQS
jgi:O-6-methylguanine DNA methyltransferase